MSSGSSANVNCASTGCPALRPEAFQTAKLDAQMDEHGRAFLRDASKNHLDASSKTLYLSSSFDWFKGDLVAKSGSVEKFIVPYVSDADRKMIEKAGLSIKYTNTPVATGTSTSSEAPPPRSSHRHRQHRK